MDGDYETEETVDELVTVSPELVEKVRSVLSEYFDKLGDAIIAEQEKVEFTEIGKLEDVKPIIPQKYAAVDGGSNILTLNVGNIGFCASVGIIISREQILKKKISSPEIIPSQIREIIDFTDDKMVRDILDRLREAKVFEVAKEIVLNENIELVVVDGPLMPPGAIIPPHKKISEQSTIGRYLIAAFKRYRKAIKDLFKVAKSKEVSVVGFVKRPHSKILGIVYNRDWRMYDHIMLSKIIKPHEFFPNKPVDYPITTKWEPSKEYEELVKELNVKFLYLRTVESAPPFRVDFGPIFVDFKKILAFLVATATSDGIPFGVLKADEETKMGAQLVRELHEDLVHEFLRRLVEKGEDITTVIDILGIYGGML